MEHYNYFCTITKHLYQELETVAATSFAISYMGLDNSEYEEKKLILLQKIEDHLRGFDLALFDKDLED